VKKSGCTEIGFDVYFGAPARLNSVVNGKK